MQSLDNAAGNVVKFLQLHGFCPEKVGNVAVCVQAMTRWTLGNLTDEQVIKVLTNTEILSGKSLKPDKEKTSD